MLGTGIKGENKGPVQNCILHYFAAFVLDAYNMYDFSVRKSLFFLFSGSIRNIPCRTVPETFSFFLIKKQLALRIPFVIL